MPDIQRREPLIFAIGDTLSFQRHLVDFPASKGFSLEYQLFGIDGSLPGIVFNSIPAADNPDDHYCSVANFAAAVPPGEYVLGGYALNVGTGERHQIYRGELTLTANLAGSTAIPSEISFEQEMVTLNQQRVRNLTLHEYTETDVQRVKFVRAQLKDARLELNFWEERLAFLKKSEAVANGACNPNYIRARFNIA